MSAPYPVGLYPGCPCYACDSQTWPKRGDWTDVFSRRMSLCPSCGDKRCPGASHHSRHPAVVGEGENQ